MKKQSNATRVVNGKVILSPRREADLAAISDPKSRAQLRKVWETKALNAYNRRSKPFGMGQAESGRHVFVAGQGSFRAAVFSREGGLELLKNIAQFKKLILSLPEEGTVETDADDVSIDE